MKHVFPQDLVENETASALHKTLAYLEENGWRQGVTGHNGGVCVGLALQMVGGGMHSPAAQCLREAVGMRHIENWNDSPLTTLDMVVDALHKAIEIACRT